MEDFDQIDGGYLQELTWMHKELSDTGHWKWHENAKAGTKLRVIFETDGKVRRVS